MSSEFIWLPPTNCEAGLTPKKIVWEHAITGVPMHDPSVQKLVEQVLAIIRELKKTPEIRKLPGSLLNQFKNLEEIVSHLQHWSKDQRN
jgi:hypothetical protein